MVKITKIVVCGMKGVGKTTILEQLIYGRLNEKIDLYPTIEDIYVAHVESDKGTKEKVRFYDTAGIEYSQISTASGMTNQQLPRHYLLIADGYVLVYDTLKSISYDILVSIKKDIDKNKDKKEVSIIVIGNSFKEATDEEADPIVNKVNQWCTREKIKHFTVSALNRKSLYEPFVFITSKLTPPPSKSTLSLSMGRKAVKES